MEKGAVPDTAMRARHHFVHPHLIGGQGKDAVQVLHQLFEGGSVGGDGVPTVFHHHVPGVQKESEGGGEEHQLTFLLPASGLPHMCSIYQNLLSSRHFVFTVDFTVILLNEPGHLAQPKADLPLECSLSCHSSI